MHAFLRDLAVTDGLEAPPVWLLGVWKLFRADRQLDFAPGVRMEFRTGGHLRYHIDVAGQDRVIDLLYRVDGDVLLTDNPANPHATAVRFAHGEGDVLILDFAGPRAWLIREDGAHRSTDGESARRN
ncbi:MAG: hypothetical protein MUF00_11465 [Gemmatimonadaceae bacterium]|jgi:hypothetical protein|nr:hypothetical protein [Gemmatimonadaceae bacterium]